MQLYGNRALITECRQFFLDLVFFDRHIFSLFGCLET